MNKTKWNKIKPALRKNNNNNQAIKRASNYTLTANYKIQTFKFRAKKGIEDLWYIFLYDILWYIVQTYPSTVYYKYWPYWVGVLDRMKHFHSNVFKKCISATIEWRKFTHFKSFIVPCVVSTQDDSKGSLLYKFNFVSLSFCQWSMPNWTCILKYWSDVAKEYCHHVLNGGFYTSSECRECIIFERLWTQCFPRASSTSDHPGL